MRTRAGIVLVQDGKVALIERYRAGLHYYVFPGGGVDEGEIPEQAAVREAMEELGIHVTIQQKVAEIELGSKSRQFYFLVEQTGGEFGTGTGEEYTDSHPGNSEEGIYLPVWMPVDELLLQKKIYPEEIAKLVFRAAIQGWPEEITVTFEDPK